MTNNRTASKTRRGQLRKGTRLTAVVLTTIRLPVVLEQYCDNCQRHGHSDVLFVVVGDLKSPPDSAAYVHSLSQGGLRFVYLGPREQEVWLRRFPELVPVLPYNSVQRRNIGYLYAAEAGAEVIISIDDDNLPLPEYDFVGEHGVVGSIQNIKAASSSTGWFNSCSLLESSPPRRFYHRGFPFNKRWLPEKITWRSQSKRIVVNIGLWTSDPDVDTVTRLEEPFTVTGVKSHLRRVGINAGTLAPYNSQNTAFHVDLLPCLYLISLSKGGDVIKGDNNFRYDDIWMSFFQKIIIDHLGDQVAIGPPHVEQRRNPHDYMLDLRKELRPMEMTSVLADILPQISLTEDNYLGAYRELTEELRVKAAYHSAFDPEERNLLLGAISGMEAWAQVVARLKG